MSKQEHEITEAHMATIAKITAELHNAQVTRATAGCSGSFATMDKPTNNHALEHWNSLLKSVAPVIKTTPGGLHWPPIPPPPPPLPSQLGPFNWNPITFGGGTPVGGWVQLTLFQNGAYVFSGNLHDSGTPSYSDQLAFGITSKSGILFTFTHQGSMAGTFEPGSRDDGWSVSGNNPAIADDWADLCSSYNWRANATVNWNISGPLKEIEDAIAAVQAIVKVIQVVA